MRTIKNISKEYGVKLNAEKDKPEIDIPQANVLLTEILGTVLQSKDLKTWVQKIVENAAAAKGDPELLRMVMNQAKVLQADYKVRVRKGFAAVADKIIAAALRGLLSLL